jgi:phage/plasmid-like protein (TIGR03299 family)
MHEVETLAYTGQVPWHGLGIYLGAEGTKLTGGKMLVASGLDWETYKEEITDLQGNTIPGWYTVRRRGPNLSYNNHLGVVQKKFTCIQNAEIFGIPDQLVEDGRVTYEVAGSLRNGSIVFALARFSDFEIERLGGQGDPVERFLLWTAGHGTGRAVLGGYTDVRVVCKNTLDAAMGDSHGRNIKNRFKIRHTKSGPDRVSEAHRVLLKLDEYGEAQRRVYQELAYTTMTRPQAKQFYSEWLDETYGTLDEQSEEFDKRYAKREATVAELETNFIESPGNTGESAWDGFNGLSYWLDHQRSRFRSATTRMESTLLGGNVYNQKGQAVKKLLAWASDGKLKRVRG